jgi:DNA-binding beta-propeller fold protein YncE
VIDPSGTRYYVINDNDVAVFDLATDTRIDADNDGMNGVTNVLLPEQIRAHFMTISPF